MKYFRILASRPSTPLTRLMRNLLCVGKQIGIENCVRNIERVFSIQKVHDECQIAVG